MGFFISREQLAVGWEGEEGLPTSPSELSQQHWSYWVSALLLQVWLHPGERGLFSTLKLWLLTTGPLLFSIPVMFSRHHESIAGSMCKVHRGCEKLEWKTWLGKD